MKRVVPLSLAIVGLGLTTRCATAPTPPDEAPAVTAASTTPAPTPAPAAFGWTITGPGLDVPSTLYAVPAQMPADNGWQEPSVTAALVGARVIVMENGLERLTPEQARPLLHRLGNFEPGRTLVDEVGADAARGYLALLEQEGVPGDAAMGLKPWLLQDQLQELAIPPSWKAGIDLAVAGQPEAAQAPIVGLETIPEQMERAAHMPTPLQVTALGFFLLHKDAVVTATTSGLYEPWSRRDLDAVVRALEAVPEPPEVRAWRRAVAERHHALLAARLVPILAEPGPEVVVLGLDRAVGDEGVVEKLRARGYRVEPLR